MDEGRYCLTGDCEGKLPGTRTAHRTLHDTMGWYRAWHHRPLRTAIHTFLALVAITIIGALIVSYAPNRLNPQAAAGILKQFPFQGRLTNSDGTVVANGSYDVVFKLYTVSSGGSAAWTENHTGGNQVTTVDGIFNTMLGSITSLSGIDFNQDTYYIGVTVGADAEMTPRIRLGAAPYAFNADQLDGKDQADFVLLTGRAGGQTIHGGTAAGNDLALHATTHASGGEIIIGGSVAENIIIADTGVGQDGQVSIGTSSFISDTKMRVYYVPTSGGAHKAFESRLDTGFSVDESNALYAIHGRLGAANTINYTSTTPSAGLLGMFVYSAASGTFTAGSAVHASVSMSGGGTVTNLYGSSSIIDIASTGGGTMTAAFAALSPTTAGAGAYTTGAGLLVQDFSENNFTTSYGILVQDQTTGSGTVYGFAQQGAGDNNYFQGNLMVGTNSAPARALEVRSTSTQQRWSYDGSNNAEIAVSSAGVASITASGNRVNIGAANLFDVNTSTGNVGIGAAPATNDRFTVTYSPSSPASAPTAINTTLAPTYAANTSHAVFGIQSVLTLASAFDYSAFSQSIRGVATYSAASGTVTGALDGVHGVGQHNGAGTVKNLYGISGVVNHLSTGGGTTAAAILAATPTATGSGTFTGGYGLLVADQSVARYTTSYGIHIQDQGSAAGTTWAFGSTGLDDNSFFGGSLMVGDDIAASANLEVVADGVTAGTHDQVKVTSSRAAIVSSDLIGGVQFASDDTSLSVGSDTVTAYIRALATQTHTGSALGTALSFGVTANATTSPFEAMNIDQTGNVGIGIAPSSIKRLSVDLDGTANSAYVAGEFSLDTSGFTGTPQVALRGTVTTTGSGDPAASAVGAYGSSVVNKTSGTADMLAIGVYGVGSNQGSISVANLRGVSGQVVTHSTGGASTRAAAFVAQVPSYSATSTIAESNGILIANQADAVASVSYGLRILTQTGSTTTWGIGIDGASLNNYINGKLSVGLNTAPTARLHVSEPTIGNEVIRLESVATSDDPVTRVIQGRLATTNATPGTVATVAISASKTYMIRAEVVARCTGGASCTADNGAAYKRTGTYKTTGGTVTLIAAGTADDYVAEDVAGWDAALVISGTNVIVQATGAATTNITWHTTVWINEVGT